MSLVKLYKEQVSRITKLAEDHTRTESSLNTMASRERMAWNDKKDRLELFKEQLVKESNEHVVIYGATKKRLAQEKMHWFENGQSSSHRLSVYSILSSRFEDCRRASKIYRAILPISSCAIDAYGCRFFRPIRQGATQPWDQRFLDNSLL